MKQDERTPGPWKVSRSIEGDFLGIYPDTGKNEFPIAKMPDYVRADVAEANAALIVKAVNAYTSTEALREALVRARELLIACNFRPETSTVIQTIDAALSGSPAPSTEGLREWQPIAGAPRDQNIIVAAMNTYSKTYTVGEARWQSDDPDHPDDGDWWWDIPPGDYTVDSILNMNGPVEFWQPLPAAPDAARTALAGVTAPATKGAE